ncbi:MAG: histidine kinase [Anaerolineae bacterium]|nr:histidine kinase [Anaerolineae bacterium]
MKVSMLRLNALREPLIKRLILFFLTLGLLPTVLLVVAPTIYVALHGTESVAESLLLMWGAQGVTFVIIVLIGASIILKQLALPIQELVNATDKLAEGEWSYRVPIRSADQELTSLMQAFNKMADAIETMRAELQSALEERERAFDAILQVTNLVNSQADLNETIERALQISHNAVKANTIALVLFDDSGQISSTAAVCRECPESPRICREQCRRRHLLQKSFRVMHDNVFQQAIQRGRKIHISNVCSEDAGLEPEVIDAICKLDARQIAIVPLLIHGSALGMIVLMRPELTAIPFASAMLVDALAKNMTILIKNRYLQDKSRALTIMEERRHLARELHDSVTQSLFTLSLTARGLKASLSSMPGVDCQPFDILVEQTKVVQTDMRKLINELRPVELESYDLEEALQQHAQSLRRAANVDVRLSVRGDIGRLSWPIQRNLNRIAQEALSNIARHAEARHAEISLEISDQLVTLTIWDDGEGFDSRAAAHDHTASLGLESMRERAEMLGGALIIRSQIGVMTSITAKIPLATEESITDV